MRQVAKGRGGANAGLLGRVRLAEDGTCSGSESGSVRRLAVDDEDPVTTSRKKEGRT